MQKIVGILLIFVIFLIGCSRQKSTEMDLRVVAKAGDIEFTMFDLDSYMIRMNYSDPADELYKKKDFLEQQMAKLILADAGMKIGLLDSIEVDSVQVSRILYEMVYKQNITDKLDVNDRNVRRYWEKYGGEIHLAQIMVQDENLADSLSLVLDNDADKFIELVRVFSEDPITRVVDGDLNWRRVTSVPDELQESAFSLKEGEISKPIHSSLGIHILKMLGRRGNTEQDFENEKSNYRQLYSIFRRSILQDQFFESIKDELDYNVYWEPVQVIIDRAISLRETGFTPETALSFCITNEDLTEEEKAELVASIDGLEYNAAQFLSDLKRNYRKDGINFDKRNVAEKLISRLMLPHMMAEYGRKHELTNTPQYERLYEHTEIGYVYQLMQTEYLLDTVVVTEDEVRERYEKTKWNFEEPEQIRCFEIFVETEGEALLILQQLNKGVPFSELVKKTIRPGFAETGGNLGFCSNQRFGPIYAAAKDKKAGEYAGPINWDGRWAVIKVGEKIPKHIKPFSEVENQVRTMTLASKKYTIYHDYVDELEKNIESYIDEDLIKDNLLTGKIKDES
jgi:parvulin-like peptidyl-prolyl isomerase